jgi:outer membrane protein insertion porin family/translocation and assembly module TamA
LYTQSVSEYNAYRRTTAIGGVASVVWRATTRTPINLSYSMDLGRTEAQPALFCAVFNLCDAEERQRIEKTQRLAILSLAATRDNSNNVLSPTRGSIIRVEARHSSPVILSDTALQFNKFVGDASRYINAGGGNVLALRIRGGVVYGRTLGSATGFIPPSERLYAGGPNTVRGFAQNELGSAIYIAPAFQQVLPAESGRPDTLVKDTTGVLGRVVPVGGNSLVVANVELRLRSPVLPELLQLTLFTDAGEVWNRGSPAALSGVKLKITPGVQVTAFSPVGPVRAAIGYNPYRRPAGPLYFEATNSGGELLCVSPGNQLPTHFNPGTQPGSQIITQDPATGTLSCPASFEPPKVNTFRSRLTFSFAIGQAF